MQLGFCLPFAGSWATPDNQVTVARRAEELGYSSLWVAQRLFYPLEPRNDYPSAPGQPWPAPFQQVVDPIVTLAHVAGATRRIRLGTATLIAVYVAPVVLAKQLATLDIVSEGRLDVGLGLGWSQDEYEACGVPFAERGARLDEYLRCLHALWSDDPVEFSGRFYSVPRSLFQPKPHQRPRPPLLVGGYAPATVRRAATLGDGYLGGNVPLISKLDPATIVAGSATPVSVKITGTQLGTVASVRVNTVDRPPDSKSDKEITFTLNADDIKQAGQIEIKVVTADGIVSEATVINVSEPTATDATAPKR